MIQCQQLVSGQYMYRESLLTSYVQQSLPCDTPMEGEELYFLGQ